MNPGEYGWSERTAIIGIGWLVRSIKYANIEYLYVLLYHTD